LGTIVHFYSNIFVLAIFFSIKQKYFNFFFFAMHFGIAFSLNYTFSADLDVQAADAVFGL